MARLLDADRHRLGPVSAHHLRACLWPQPRARHTRGSSIDRVSFDRRPFRARVYRAVVFSLHAPCNPSCRSRTSPNKGGRAEDGLDRREGQHFRNRIVDAGHAFRSHTAPDLFSSRASGRRPGHADNRRTGNLGLSSRHRRTFSLAAHDVCGGHRSRLQPLAPVSTTLPSVEFPQVDDYDDQ